MQVEATRMYRVKALADMLDVHPATIYRAIDSGKLAAVRLGQGAGAVRVSGQAFTEYLTACGMSTTAEVA